MQPPPSAVNFRDLGGQPTRSGHRTRAGVLFRSASPQFLTRGDAARLVRDTSLRLVLDLRYEAESAAEGHGELTATGVRVVNVPIVGAGGEQVEMNVLAGSHNDHLGAHYISYVQLNPASFVTAFRELAQPDALPALVHCAAGKDRTGVLVAMLLSVLGVPDNAIAADYARTADHLPSIVRNLRTAPTYASTIGLRPLDDEFAQSPPATMGRFLGWLAAEHRSAEQMLLDAGLEPEALETLRHRLVTRTAA